MSENRMVLPATPRQPETSALVRYTAEAMWRDWHGENAHHCAGKPKWSGYSAGFCGQQASDEYSPDSVAFWHSGRCPRPNKPGGCRWAMLESAVEGGTGCSGMGSGRGERLGLAHLKADLEHAADQLPIYWQATRTIFSKQHRYSVWLARWHDAGNPETGPDQEPLELSAAVDLAIWRMAVSLGWQEGLTDAA